MACSSHFNKIVAVVVAYNSGNELSECLTTASQQVNELLIIDNSDTPTGRDRVASIVALHKNSQLKKIELIQNNTNLGLGSAQNIGISRAIDLGADWVLLLDDDSSLASNMIHNMKHGLLNHPDSKCFGIVAPRVVDINSGKRYPCLKIGSRWMLQRIELSETMIVEDSILAMASGSLIRVEMLREIGLMREDFFIDLIDWEFSHRAVSAGWRILFVGSALLNQRLGGQTKIDFLGRRCITNNYPPFRYYTTARNRILFWKLTFPNLSLGCFFYQALSWGYEILKVLLLESDKARKILAMFKGLFEGLLLILLNRTPTNRERVSQLFA